MDMNAASEILKGIAIGIGEGLDHLIHADAETLCVTADKRIHVRPQTDHHHLRCLEKDCRFNTQGVEGEILTLYTAVSTFAGPRGAYVCQGAEKIKPSKKKRVNSSRGEFPR